MLQPIAPKGKKGVNSLTVTLQLRLHTLALTLLLTRGNLGAILGFPYGLGAKRFPVCLTVT